MSVSVALEAKKRITCFTNNPTKSLVEHNLNQIQAKLEIFCKNYEHLLMIGDFNANISALTLTSFCTIFKGTLVQI